MSRPFWDGELHVGAVPRNERGEEIRVRVVTRNGRDYVDVRTFYPAGDELRPGKGLTMPMAAAGDVADLIRQAHQKWGGE